MIHQVKRIKSFGVFSDFQWPATLPNFKQFNLIYGWNYSGKTTLSRVFRCFEQRKKHEDFLEAQVQLVGQDGNTHDLVSPETAPVFKVFNSDFVRDNLSLEDGNASPILVLGAEDIAKQEDLKTKKAELQQLVTLKQEIFAKNREKVGAIEKALTQYARDYIKNPLNRLNYDKTKFEPKVETCKDAPEKHLLDAGELAQCQSVYHSTEQRRELAPIQMKLSLITQIRDETSALMARIVTASRTIDRLKEDPKVERWVNDGRTLHEAKTTCQFCGQVLPPDLLINLSEHFSAEYDGLMSDLTALAKRIENTHEENIDLPHPGRLYQELTTEYETVKTQWGNLQERRKAALDILGKAITEKQTKAFTKLECPEVEELTEQIEAALAAINEILAKHNTRTKEFDTARTQAFSKLELHYAALFVRNQSYKEQLQQIAAMQQLLAEQEKKINFLGTAIKQLESELSGHSRGAERINVLLRAYFGRDDLHVIVSPDNRFCIIRGKGLAKNLSEGEKTAIAFAHFITLVQDGQHPLTDTRIVIDDPISSLDANHLFNTYALIKTQFSDCRQLFIATHSFDFYNLVRDWIADEEKDLKRPQTVWKKWGVFILKRRDSGECLFEEIPKELIRFKSEYHYLFSILYHFDQESMTSFDFLLSLPNVVRRFMEAFGGIMIPTFTGLQGKMSRLFPDQVEKERVWKFINQYSHNNSVTRSLIIPDMSECKGIVRSCLQAVKRWNANYFEELKAEIN